MNDPQQLDPRKLPLLYAALMFGAAIFAVIVLVMIEGGKGGASAPAGGHPLSTAIGGVPLGAILAYGAPLIVLPAVFGVRTALARRAAASPELRPALWFVATIVSGALLEGMVLLATVLALVMQDATLLGGAALGLGLMALFIPLSSRYDAWGVSDRSRFVDDPVGR